MARRSKTARARLLCGSALASVTLWASAAAAQDAEINIPPQSLATALYTFAGQSGHQVMFSPELTGAKTTGGVSGIADREQALRQLLAGSGLSYQREDDTFLIVRAADPQSGSAAGDGADGTVEALIVTAQKREEDIQDVPIAISAFTQEDLTRSQVAGGPDLMTQVPNFTFTKTNFSSYSIQIRGIGTQAVSATVDPAVAVAFNNTPFVRNRFFEQEFYDLQRVEVLRGPQGTLYGRNATAGVVNIISAKPKFNFEAKVSGDVSNYNSSRVEGMINIPLVDDVVALRVAGAWTKRDGYVTNQITNDQIDGRDLWSTRVSLRFAPNDRFDANLIWEHFEEDDDRLRSGKQTCKRDVVAKIAGIPIAYEGGAVTSLQGNFSQGCAPSSMYSPDSFQTPNGFTVQYYHPLKELQFPTVAGLDPYLSTKQSRDLRVIESTLTPTYQAETDVVQLQMSLDLGRDLTLASETSYGSDTLFSFQDLNRFNTAPGIFDQDFWDDTASGFSGWRPNLLNNGTFCDPQLGCANRLVAGDLSAAESAQFSQELRLSSDFNGPFNFSLGGNFLRYDTEDKYYVFINTISFLSAMSRSGHGSVPALSPWEPGVTDNFECLEHGVIPPDPTQSYEVDQCIYIDPNPINSLNDEGHNYFLSRNPFKLISYAIFGETYYNFTDNLKLTAGLRWTVDKKEAPRIYSWLLGSDSVGHPVVDVIRQEWREPTGRLAIDWKPDLSFTDETLLYASYAHGYKAGGANPPPPGSVIYCATCGNAETAAAVVQNSATHPRTFEPEFIDAFELGSKNTFLDGKVTVNLAAFYYDYEGYQISQIVNRSAVNLNFDATVWGLEVEADWRPLENLRLGFKGGYEDTRVADGEKAIDLMDRTAGDPNWVLLRPHPALTSNCIMPLEVIILNGVVNVPGAIGSGFMGGCEQAYLLGNDPITGQPYDPENPGGNVQGYDGFDPSTAPNNGEGIDKDLSGNQLPNAPSFTATITADYTVPLPNDWLMTLHTDLYYQSEAWTRIFNMEGYDKLKAYSNINVAAIFANEDAGWQVMAYVKNVLDKDNITGAFLFSDDTLLTTNAFLNEPRLYGIRVTKNWSGGSWAFAERGRDPGERYPFTVELGGGVQRFDAPSAPFAPEFFDQFAAPVDPQAGHSYDLDWGDGRAVKLTYAPASSPFTASLGARFGRTNGVAKGETRDPHKTCIVGMALCEAVPKYYRYPADYALNKFRTNEEYTLADFAIGRDVGLGAGLRSQVQLGLRYAQFQSDQRLDQLSVPDWVIPAEYSAFAQTQHHRYDTSLASKREFEGFGPTISWEASKTLFGGAETGQVDLEWTVTGGVLFGRQTTDVTGSYQSDYFDNNYFVLTLPPKYPPTSTVIEPVSIHRSQSTQTPLLDLSLGLAYDVGRVKVGAGYRWERYFDVLDTGYDEREESDRTVDGPYFKLSGGFGG